ncbi:MAG: DegT/DnrJ/EryC1/StrS family aminotransferase [Terracidiphilus sp.]
MPIPLSAPDITEAEIAAVTAVLRTPHLSLGPELAAFEAAFAKYHRLAHAVAVSSGTAGLHMALLTLNIGEGDEVIVPSFAFIAVANAVLHIRATPVFADIDPVTLNLTPSTVEPLITPRTRAILVVHTFGIPADMHALRALATRHSLVIIEDACEAIGAELHQRRVGGFGDLSVFGFYPNKQITTGEGGAVLAHTQAHADRLRSLRNQGRIAYAADIVQSQKAVDWLHHPEIGFNYRLSDIACALGRVQLSRIGEILSLRRAAAERYYALLADIPGLQMPPLTLPGCTISWFVFVVRLPQTAHRASIQALLSDRAIATASYFAPIHQQPAWRDLIVQFQPHLPTTETLGSRTLALPFFTRIALSQQEQVASALRQALATQN